MIAEAVQQNYPKDGGYFWSLVVLFAIGALVVLYCRYESRDHASRPARTEVLGALGSHSRTSVRAGSRPPSIPRDARISAPRVTANPAHASEQQEPASSVARRAVDPTRLPSRRPRNESRTQ